MNHSVIVKETIVDALMKITKFTDLMAYNENYAKVEDIWKI